VNGGQAAALEGGRSTWAASKGACATYHYRRGTSSFVGYNTDTTVEITNDQPSWRSYVATSFVAADGGSTPGIVEQWQETAGQIGSHTSGAPALTVEQLFDACTAVLANDPATNTITLSISAEGVPKTCTFLPHNCADDCLMGFALSFACGPSDRGVIGPDGCHLPIDAAQPFGNGTHPACPLRFDDQSWIAMLCPFPSAVDEQQCGGYRSRRFDLGTHSWTCYYDPAALTLVAGEFINDVDSFCDGSSSRVVLGQIPTAGTCAPRTTIAVPCNNDGGVDSGADAS
jgi:hypothetical protein